MFLLALLSLCAVGYAHYRLAFLRSRPLPTWIAQLLLIAVGLGFGWTMHSAYVEIEGRAEAWVFILAFGSVHVPAAVILWLKKQRSKQLK